MDIELGIFCILVTIMALLTSDKNGEEENQLLTVTRDDTAWTGVLNIIYLINHNQCKYLLLKTLKTYMT